MPVKKFGARDLEKSLRGALSVRRKAVHQAQTDGGHDCVKAERGPPECDPMSASTVCQIRSIRSVPNARVPLGLDRHQRGENRESAEAGASAPQAALRERIGSDRGQTFELSSDRGILVWLVMKTGMRPRLGSRPRWFNVRLDKGHRDS
jgi:hypothetical protein